MSNTPFKLIPSHGSYFECYSYAEFSDERDKDLAIRLTRENAVATIPMSSFTKTKLITEYYVSALRKRRKRWNVLFSGLCPDDYTCSEAVFSRSAI